MIILLNFIGLGLIVLIIWWFWLSQTKAITTTEDIIQIEIKDGVYNPAKIALKASQSVVLEFTRYDSAGCSDTVIFSTLAKQITLPLDEPQRLELGQLSPGKYPFACPMNMYKGELIIQ